MKASEVIQQLYDKIPQFTDKFTEEINIDSITSIGNIATLTTSSNHTLSAGDLANIHGIDTPLNISSLVRVGDTLEIETSENHDLTLGHQSSVEIIGANESVFNGVFDLIDVKNRRNFKLKTTAIGPTIATGTIQALNISSIEYNGLYNVQSIISSTVFTYELSGTIVSDSTGAGTVSTGFRITGAASLQRAIESYTRQGTDKYYLFVVLGNVVASKDRNINSDAVAIVSGGVEWKQQLIQPFSIYAITPATQTVSARDLRDEFEDIASFIFKSIVGVKFDSGLAQGKLYQTVFDAHGFQEYDGTKYIHFFNFQTVADLTFDDTIGEPENVAFRDIDLTIATNLMTDDTEKMNGNVDLDDAPL